MSESVKKPFKLPNDRDHHIISKVVMDIEAYMPFYDVPTRQESKVLLFEDDPMPTMVKSQREMKKSYVSRFLQKYGLIKAIKLEGQKTVTANWSTPKCLPEVFQDVNVRGLMLHYDSASSHTARLTTEFLKQKQIIMIEHPPYFPDLAMCVWRLVIF
ncbi:uncharacterized protein TNCV_4315401 [Trichonephila clavipes]|nr:uncharacterized protein TNCV_4315401 [Trichonephila clavipes]